MQTKKVIVLPHDCVWKEQFETIKSEIEAVLGDLAISIEHIGSTSVEGLWAKPIIDIDVIIKDYTVFNDVERKLNSIGYIHEGDLGIKGREAFKYFDKSHLQRHHLYICPKNSKELQRHIAFRDYLRENQDEVIQYSEIKKQAAELFPHDIEKYIEYKSDYIKKIYSLCGIN